MKIFRYFVLAFCLSVFPVPKLDASGIPVIDILNLVETITIYIQQLTDYAELLAQTSILNSQYVQMLLDYYQTLQEYNHYLNQLKGFKHMLSEADWASVVKEIAVNYGSSGFASVVTMNSTNSGFHNELRKVLQNYSLAPMKAGTAVAEYEKYISLVDNGIDFINKEFKELNNIYERYETQQEAAVSSDKNLSEIELRRVNLAEKLVSLPDESDLATLQLMATQQSLLIEQQRHMATIATAQLQHYESFSNFSASALIKGYNNELDRLKRVKSNVVKLTGISKFSDLGL